MATNETSPAFPPPPWYAAHSKCEGVYDGEEHWAVFANHCRGVIADVEGGLTPEAKAKAEFIARACNVYRDLVEALDFLLKQTVDLDLANGIGLTDGEREARKKALSALKTANGQAA